MFTEVEVKEIKKKIIEQIDKLNIDDKQKESIKNYINSLDNKGLEEFLIKNKINVVSKNESKKQQQNCLFCMIVNRELESYKVDEDDKSVAVLDIKPISKGHVIIVPKEHCSVEDISPYSFFMALKIAKRIKQLFNPREINISTSSFFGHSIINVVPLFGNETGKRKKASKEELIELQRKLIEMIGKENGDSSKESKDDSVKGVEKKEDKVEENVKESEEKTGIEENFELKMRIP